MGGVTIQSMEIRALIVDDERKARELLAIMIGKVSPEVSITMCSSVAEAVNEIRNKKPDLVFLDVEMPGELGITLFDSTDIEFDFEVVFTTAHSGYAVQAFQVNAIDYILKPVSVASLQKAMDKVRSKLASRGREKNVQLLEQIRKLTESPRIGFPTTNGVNFVEVSQIRRCEASSNYTTVFFVNGEKTVVSRTLKDLEDALTPYSFCRIHKSHLVRISQIVSYKKGEIGSVTLVDGSVLPVSRTMRADLEQNLKII